MRRIISALSVLLAALAATAWIQRAALFPLDRLQSYSSDSSQMVWNLWITQQNIELGHSPFSTTLAYWPVGANLTHHTLASGFYPVTFLVTAFTGKTILGYIVAYNVCLWLSVSLMLAFTYGCLRELKVGRCACIAASLSFGLCVFFRASFFNLNHISGFFIPLCAWLAVRLYNKPSSVTLYAYFLAASVSVYYTEFIAYIALLCLYMLAAMLFFETGRIALKSFSKLPWYNLLLAPLVALVIASPLLWHYYREAVPGYDLNEHSKFSANLAGLFVPAQGMTNLYGGYFAKFASQVTLGASGYWIFVGYPLLLPAILVVAVKRSPWLLVSLLGSLLFLTLSLGPWLKLFTVQYDLPMPYQWVMDFPLLKGSRTPARLAIVGIFLVSLLGGYGLHLLERSFAQASWKKLSLLPPLLAVLWVYCEISAGVSSPKPAWSYSDALVRVPKGLVLPIPHPMVHGFVGISQIVHQQPTVTGTVVRLSAAMHAQWWKVNEALKNGPSAFASLAKAMGIASILILPDAAPDERTARELDAIAGSGLPVVDLRKQPKSFAGFEGCTLLTRYTAEPFGPSATVSSDRPLTLRSSSEVSAGEIELYWTSTSSCNFEFYRADTLLATMIVPKTAKTAGFQHYEGTLPASLTGVTFDRLVIRLDVGGLATIKAINFRL